MAKPMTIMTMNKVVNIRAMKAKFVRAARNVFRLEGTKFQIRLYCNNSCIN